MNEVLNSAVRSQTGAILNSVELVNCRSRSKSIFGQEEEINADFFSPAGLVCCGEELSPFWADDGRLMSTAGDAVKNS